MHAKPFQCICIRDILRLFIAKRGIFIDTDAIFLKILAVKLQKLLQVIREQSGEWTFRIIIKDFVQKVIISADKCFNIIGIEYKRKLWRF